MKARRLRRNNVTPQSLLLDGQQRMTSLYQVTLRGKVVETVTPKKKKVKRWFYIDIRKALDPSIDREEAIIGVPEDKIVRIDFGREVDLDLSSAEREYASLMYPVCQVFDWDKWQDGFDKHWRGDQNQSVREEFRAFKRQVLENFKCYRVPVITLDRSTSKEAVCVVFEKVNTGGKALDAFELVTAMYAASGHELRKDWYGDDGTKGRHRRFAETLRPAGADTGIIAGVGNTDFLQAISLFHTRDRRRAAEKAGKQGKELPAVSGNRQALLNLPLEAYKQYEAQVERGFVQAAKFLHMLHIYRIFDLPYQSQIVPLAAILADIGDAWEHEANRAKLVQMVLEWRLRRALWFGGRNAHSARFHGSAGLAEGRPRTINGQRDYVSRRPIEDHAHASVRCLQGRQRSVDEGRSAGFSFGPKIRPHGILRRECGHPSHLPARVVQETSYQAEHL